jgi:hypothetical protein
MRGHASGAEYPGELITLTGFEFVRPHFDDHEED